MPTATLLICPICETSDYRKVRQGVRHNPDRVVYECNLCGLQFLELDYNPQEYYASGEYRKRHTSAVGREVTPAERFDLHRPFMDELRDDPHVRWEKHWTVLEVGCSSGYFLDSVSSSVAHVFGIDLNADDAEWACSLPSVDGAYPGSMHINAERLPANVVCAFNVLEHQANPLMFLDELKSKMTSGGYIYLEVPNLNDALVSTYKNEAFSNWWYRDPHLWNFDASTFHALMKKAGFRGRVWNTHGYSLYNNLRWLYESEPQATVKEGRGVPIIQGNEKNQKTFNHFFARVDKEYRDMACALGLGSHLRYWGQVTSNASG
jgi:2-polyprenyl-3-methyl-5-hydroxy-6-metoxy-1,4-benzoquinol methylase